MKYLKYLFLLVLAVLSSCGRPEVQEPMADFVIIGECPLPGYAKKVELVGISHMLRMDKAGCKSLT